MDLNNRPIDTCLCEVLTWLHLLGRHVQERWRLGLRIPPLGSSRVRRVISHTGAFSWMRKAPFCHPSSLIAVISPTFHLGLLTTPHSFYDTFPHFITPSLLHLSRQASFS